MATAAVPIVNRALALLGDRPITDLEDADVRAQLANTEYEPLVLEAFQNHDWNFASVRVANLVRLADNPAWGGLFAYGLPPGCVRVRATSLDVAEGGGGEPWAIESHSEDHDPALMPSPTPADHPVLVTKAEGVSIRFTKRMPEGLWPGTFAAAVVFELAHRLCYGITGKQTLVADGGMLDIRKVARRLALAKALDGQEGSPRSYVTTALLRGRF